MLPHIHIDDLSLLGIPIHPFGLLVALAVMVGSALAKWRAKKRGLDAQQLESFIGWTLVLGFASAHILDEVLYHPRKALENPLSLLYIWQGIGSFSGWLGALAGVVLWQRYEWKPRYHWGKLSLSMLVRRKEKIAILPYADVILSVFPIAWIFGRGGCSIAHDHPGAPASEGAPLAVAFPSPDPNGLIGPGDHATFGPITVTHGHFPRYDLGTLELFFTIALSIVFVLLWRRQLVTGAYVAIVSLAYPPVRFAMDFLRIEGPGGDARYAALTPAQWMCIALFGFGLVLLRNLRRSRDGGGATAPP